MPRFAAKWEERVQAIADDPLTVELTELVVAGWHEWEGLRLTRAERQARIVCYNAVQERLEREADKRSKER